MKAIYICQELRDYITSEKLIHGTVHSVFNNACNIETKDKFITLLSKNKYMVPMSLIVDIGEEINFNSLGIKQNSEMELNVNVIKFNERNIYIDLEKAQSFFPGAVLKPSILLEENLLKNIKVIGYTLKTQGKLYGIGPLINILKSDLQVLELISLPIDFFDNNFDFIRNRFINFIKTVIDSDIENISYMGGSVIGFGIGLTPSMDDFISGIMISFIYLGSYYKLNMSRIYEFNKELIKRGLNKTTRVSSEMLMHSSKGKTNEAVRELMLSIIHELDKEKIIKALIKTINFGETSGSDTALGIYVGCKIMTNLRYRRVWLNEVMHRY